MSLFAIKRVNKNPAFSNTWAKGLLSTVTVANAVLQKVCGRCLDGLRCKTLDIVGFSHDRVILV